MSARDVRTTPYAGEKAVVIRASFPSLAGSEVLVLSSPGPMPRARNPLEEFIFGRPTTDLFSEIQVSAEQLADIRQVFPNAVKIFSETKYLLRVPPDAEGKELYGELETRPEEIFGPGKLESWMASIARRAGS